MSVKDESISRHVEEVDMESSDASAGSRDRKTIAVAGTVKLVEGNIVLIPAPSADPKDPLNFAGWQKLLIVIIVSIFSTIGLALVSGLGGLLGFYIPVYSAQGKTYADITALMTYPTLFMGIGNLIGMPLAYAIGRRIVLLVSTAVLVATAIMCANAFSNYEFHLASRCLLGLAAGQSEALVPLIISEVVFLHERSHNLMIQQFIQVILTAVLVLFAGPIAGAITPAGWYYLAAGLAGLLLVPTFFFVPETKYPRSKSALQESSSSDSLPSSPDASSKDNDTRAFNTEEESALPKICTTRPAIDTVNFTPRTLATDLRLWVGPIEWPEAVKALTETFSLIIFPQVFWVMCLNGLVLGTNVALATTYSAILTAPPYNWPTESASYVNCGQIVTAVVALPLFGKGSDRLIRWFADRRGGIHEPETRLIPLVLPTIIGTFTAVLYGVAASRPQEGWHWFVYVWTIAAYFFTFVGANIVSITYLLDSFPTKSGPLLIIICAFRGIISFGVSYGIAPFTERYGYDGAFGTFGGLTGVFGALGIVVYFTGKRLRQFMGKYI